MTRHGPALLALSVLAIAGWTYNVNYDTRAALDRLSELRARIAEEREALQVLRVEWAWLNAPDRLSRLVAEHEERLALRPLKPEALGYVAAVPYPRGVPVEPLPAPEALIAAAPQAQTVERTGAAPRNLSDAKIAVLTAPEPAGTADAAALDGTAGAMTEPDPTGLATAEAADQAVAAGAGQPVTMQDAVTLALIEAGIVQPGAAGAAVIPASAAAGIPVPPARPALWARQ